MKNKITLLVFFLFYINLFSQSEDDVVINEFVVNPTTGREYIELLVVTDGVDLRGWTISDVGTRGGATGPSEGDITLPNATYLQSVPRGTYIVIELTVPTGNSSTLIEDLDYTDDRRLIIKTTTTGVTTSGTLDISTTENIQVYAGTRAIGTLIDQVLAGSNVSLISGATWGDNNATTTTDNINGSNSIPSNNAVRFVPVDQSSPAGFQDNDTGARFVLDANSYGTPGSVNTGVNDHGGALPVELVKFFAIKSNNYILLNWVTATEIQNSGWEIQRAKIDKETNKSSVWQTIGFVKGAATSNSPKQYSFVDKSAMFGEYAYRLKQIDIDGAVSYSSELRVFVGEKPQVYELKSFPNPLNPVAKIRYELPESGNVNLSIYDLTGRLISTLVNEYKDVGIYEVEFDGSRLASGNYISVLQANGKTITRKMQLIK